MFVFCREARSCMLNALSVTDKNNYVIFIGDSRIREQYSDFLKTFIGGRKILKHASQTVEVKRLRLYLVRKCLTALLFSMITVHGFCNVES